MAGLWYLSFLLLVIFSLIMLLDRFEELIGLFFEESNN